MKLSIKPLNKGEVYCCSLKKTKELFKDTAIHINFTHVGMEFSKGFQHPLYRYANKNVKGKVIAYTIISLRDEVPLFNLFALKESEYSLELRDEFEQKHLNAIYNTYQFQNNDQNITGESRLMLVELVNDKLKLHEANLKF